MKRILSITLVCIFAIAMYAQRSAPHSVKAEGGVGSVSLTWKAPTELLCMKWHSDEDYNGVSGVSNTPSGICSVIMANRFSVDDVKEFAGLTIDSIGFFQYRKVYSATAQIYENGKLVLEVPYDMSGYEKNTWAVVKLAQPYIVKEGVELMLAAKFEHGNNVDFVAIMDRGPALKGKGNVYSYNGVDWLDNAEGNFLVTGFLGVPATEVPDGYNVYCNGSKINADLVNDTEAVFGDQPHGLNTYVVKSVYGEEEFAANPVQASVVSVANSVPSIYALNCKVKDFDVSLSWNAPFLGEASPKYSAGAVAGYLYSTTTSLRSWYAVEYTADKLGAYKNHSITAVNAAMKDGSTPKSVTVAVFENDAIVSFVRLSDEQKSAIKPGEWNKFALTNPVKVVPGMNYKICVFAEHDKKQGVVAVDDAAAVSGVCYTASSSPKLDFATSKPYWKNVDTYNLMISPDLVADGEIPGGELVAEGYDIYRNGELVSKAYASTSFTEIVTAPGNYKYEVVARFNNDRSADAVSASGVVALPKEYASPMITSATFEDGVIRLAWDTDIVEVKHYTDVAYRFGLMNEGNDVVIKYGAKLDATTLAPFVGKKIVGLNAILADDVKSMNLCVSAGNNVLASKEVDLSAFPLMSMNIVNFDTPVVIPADQDLMIYYDVVFADGKSPMVFDNGPLVEGAALFNIGLGWNSFGMVSADLKNSNVVIGAIVNMAESASAVELRSRQDNIVLGGVGTLAAPLSDFQFEPFGVNLLNKAPKATAQPNVLSPKAVSFKVYRNGKVVKEQAEKTFTETISYGDYVYAVSTVFENGWESHLTDPLSVSYWPEHKELAPAPYNLAGTAEGNDLNLTWESAENAKQMSLQLDGGSKGYGLTQSSGVEAYAAVKFAAGSFADVDGSYITHIKYGLQDVEALTSCNVFVAYDENVIYEQEVDLASLKNFGTDGLNVTMLDTPIRVRNDKDLFIGYHISYPNGKHPSIIDEGPHVEGGDIISSSGSQGYWSSLYTKSSNQIDGNHRISAVLKKADNTVVAKSLNASAATTYNVYLDGEVYKTGVETLQTTIENAPNGIYTVTAVVGGVESAMSNAVEAKGFSSVDAVEAQSAYYDAAAQKVYLGESANVSVYNASGVVLLVSESENVVDISVYPSGVYVVKAGKDTLKIVK